MPQTLGTKSHSVILGAASSKRITDLLQHEVDDDPLNHKAKFHVFFFKSSFNIFITKLTFRAFTLFKSQKGP